MLLALGIGVTGCVVSIAITMVVSKSGRNQHRAKWVATSVMLLSFLMTLSVFFPGKVSYARFGLTVYGLVPLPFLDMTVSGSGALWFREKSHRIKKEEILSLLDPETHIVVVGIGWDSIATVDADARVIPSVAVEVYDTETALIKYNEYRSQGIRVALLAHSTC